MSDKSYLPYNLSGIVPKDATIAAFNELPPPLPARPTSKVAESAPVDVPQINDDVLQSMADILASTAKER